MYALSRTSCEIGHNYDGNLLHFRKIKNSLKKEASSLK